MKKSLLRKALRIAYDQLSQHPQLDHYPHYSFIILRNKILAWATNTSQEPRIHYGYHRNWDGTYRPKMHAELHAYHKANVTTPFEIINIRLNKSGGLRLSKPCYPCFKLLTTLGCRRFWYTDESGFNYIKSSQEYPLYQLHRSDS